MASTPVCDVQEPQQKILDIETAVQMLHVVLPEGNEHLEPFCRFLKEQTEYKYMNLDQWTSFYRFSEEVAFTLQRATDNANFQVARQSNRSCKGHHRMLVTKESMVKHLTYLLWLEQMWRINQV